MHLSMCLYDYIIVWQPGNMLIVVLLTMTCISYETHHGECRFRIRGTRCGFISPMEFFHLGRWCWWFFSYFDYVLGLVNGAYGLISYRMVLWDHQGGIATCSEHISYPHIATRKQDRTHKLHYLHIATRKQDRTHKLQLLYIAIKGAGPTYKL